MVGLNRREKKIFAYSLFFHLFIGCFLFVFGLIPSCEEEPKEVHVFELAMATTQPMPIKPAPLPPKVSSNQPPLLSPTPKPAKQKPKPKPQPVVKEKPKPKVTPTKTVPKANPKPKPKVVSFNQFKQKHNLPTPSPVRSTPTHKPAYKINSSNFSLPSIQVASSSSVSRTISPSVLNAYLAMVKAKLERAWETKLSGSSISSGGETWLSFKISASGKLLGKRISRSSGNLELDRMVLAAANMVTQVASPPGGKLDSELQIPFRLN